MMQQNRSEREPRMPNGWGMVLGAFLVVGLGLWAGCIADTGVDLCSGDDPLPECVDGVPPNGQLSPSGITIPTAGDADRPNGDGAAYADDGCNPLAEPTWDNPVKKVMRDHCVRCHRAECSTYSGLMPWVQNGLLERYTVQGHYISGTDKTDVLRWITIGAPESNCDVQ